MIQSKTPFDEPTYKDCWIGCRHLWTKWRPYNTRSDRKECVICWAKRYRKAVT